MLKHTLIEFSIRHPKWIITASALITFGFLAAFPSLTVDTDPVKMLPQDNPAITLYNRVKEEFRISDMVVLGVASRDGASLFTVDGLTRVHRMTQEILEIEDPPPGEGLGRRILEAVRFRHGGSAAGEHDRRILVRQDVIAPSTIDDIVRNAAGELQLQPLMAAPPRTEAEAASILARINGNPVFRGKVSAEDGSLVAIYLPLHKGKKDRSYFLGEEIKRIVARHMGPNQRYYLAGLPLAENTFGNEMFAQMGVYAPAAGLVIFVLLLFFFRSAQMVTASMIVAMMTVIWAMGGLIYAGQTIHIMSSMIPIFLMPIAVLDSIHILSTLRDRMSRFNSRIEAVREVMGELFKPMLFTSVTTAVGFASLSLTNIPPVTVFGLTVAFGVSVAWLLSMLFIPAYFLLLPPGSLTKFAGSPDDRRSVVMEAVQMLRGIACHSPRLVVLAALVTLAISYVGLRQIVVNDNPVRWFKQDHPLRVADRAMNAKLAGTYMANLVFSVPEPPERAATDKEQENAGDQSDAFAEGDETEKPAPSIRDAEAMAYMSRAADFLAGLRDSEDRPLVGGITSILDILHKVGEVAFDDPALPGSREKISQYMFLFESGDRKKGRDMWKFITPGESRSAQMWIQLKNGDNQTMNLLMAEFAGFMRANPPPVLSVPGATPAPLSIRWSGLTHINSVWQEQMVSGMVNALAGAYLVVFVMMTLLFRSLRWGLLAMLPPTLTIVMIYGAIGLSGKFYDMPIAVLSSLTLGLSVDFAIHFIEGARQIHARLRGSVLDTLQELFQGTGRAIWRNVLVVSVGFMPLFFATLMTYVTVGAFFFAIMLVSGITTLILLSAILMLFHPWLPGFGPGRSNTEPAMGS